MNLIFLIKPFRHMTEKSRQKPKYLENEKIFGDEIKNIFYHFQRAKNYLALSSAKNCLRLESAPSRIIQFMCNKNYCLFLSANISYFSVYYTALTSCRWLRGKFSRVSFVSSGMWCKHFSNIDYYIKAVSIVLLLKINSIAK